MSVNVTLYNSAFVNALGVTEADLNESFSFDGNERWDSVAHLALITELEDAFGIFIDPEDIIRFESYSNGMRILQKYGIEF